MMDDATPEDAMPEDAMPEDAMPEDGMMDDTAPPDEMSDEAPEDTMPEDNPDEAAPEDSRQTHRTPKRDEVRGGPFKGPSQVLTGVSSRHARAECSDVCLLAAGKSGRVGASILRPKRST